MSFNYTCCDSFLSLKANILSNNIVQCEAQALLAIKHSYYFVPHQTLAQHIYCITGCHFCVSWCSWLWQPSWSKLTPKANYCTCKCTFSNYFLEISVTFVQWLMTGTLTSMVKAKFYYHISCDRVKCRSRNVLLIDWTQVIN